MVNGHILFSKYPPNPFLHPQPGLAHTKSIQPNADYQRYIHTYKQTSTTPYRTPIKPTMNNFNEKTGKAGASAPAQSPSTYPKADSGGVDLAKCKKCGKPLVSANLGRRGELLNCRVCGALAPFP